MGLYDISVTTLGGRQTTMADFKGRVLLVVNVASHCGYTPQYAGLESLYRRHKDGGFDVLGFPCNQFGGQEPGSAEDIAGFCSRTYDVTFPMFAKVDVNGPAAHPLFTLLKDERPGALGTKSIKWNFTKFLVGRSGEVLKRYSSGTSPEDIDADIAAALAAA